MKTYYRNCLNCKKEELSKDDSLTCRYCGSDNIEVILGYGMK